MSNTFRYLLPAGEQHPVEVYLSIGDPSTGLYWAFDDQEWQEFEFNESSELSLEEGPEGSWTGEFDSIATFSGEINLYVSRIDMSILRRQRDVLRDGDFLVPQAVPRSEINTHTGGWNELRVVDDDGEPVEGAEIRVMRTGDPTGDVPLMVTYSTADGLWGEGIFVSPGSYRVHIQYPGAVAVDRTVVV